MQHKIPKYPVTTIKEANILARGARAAYKGIKGLARNVGTSAGVTGRNLKRQGGNLVDYGKKLVKNPIKTLKRNAMTAGATARDAEKQFDILENSLENAIRSGQKINFKVMDKADPNAGFIRRGIQKLRGEGIATAGRRNLGNISDEAREELIKKMDAKGLIHRSKDGKLLSIHRDADVGELRKIYEDLQGIDTVSGPGVGARIRNMTNYVPLPGERGMLGLGIAGSAIPQLANKETEDGRKRGLAERIGRAGVMTAAELAVAPIGIANRLYGGLGTGVEIGGTLGTEMLLNKNNKKQNQGFYAAPRGSRTRRHGRLLTSSEPKPAMNVPGSPGSMQKQANRLIDAYHDGAQFIGTQLGKQTAMAAHTMMTPIMTGRGIAEGIINKDYEQLQDLLEYTPGIAAGYGALGYGGYKGGQKIKEKIKEMREDQEKTANIPKNPRARLRRAFK